MADYSPAVLCLCWKRVLCGRSCCPNGRCLAGTWWLHVEVEVQPLNKPPTDDKGGRSRWSSYAPDILVQPDRTGHGPMTRAGTDGDHTAPGVTRSKYSLRRETTFALPFLSCITCHHVKISRGSATSYESIFIHASGNIPLNIISIVNSKTQNGKANNRISIKPSKNSTSPGICSKVRKKSTLKALIIGGYLTLGSRNKINTMSS